MKKNFKYIYGPVGSWRLGASLGIDLFSNKKKVCNFNCIYCQLGKTKSYTRERKIYVPLDKIIEELESLPSLKIDYITFSGRGEPTLAKNLGETLKAIKKIRKEPIAILTNSALLFKKDVMKDLALADFVIAKLDAVSDNSLIKINRPIKGIKFDSFLKALKKFRRQYKGKFGLQIMFLPQNENQAKDLVRLCREIKPDEIQINTPLRPCPIKPLSKSRISKIKQQFRGLNVTCVYESCPKKVIPLNPRCVRYRRGCNWK
jgi:wyosine [tRNA(Phe)-imidazoG37] synthetase (radical SAM superfamily)